MFDTGFCVWWVFLTESSSSVDKSSAAVDDVERVDLLRHGAGLFAGLCGVFCGFVGLVAVLVLILWVQFSPYLIYFHIMVGLFVSSSFVFVVAALLFISVSMTSLKDEKLKEMAKDYALSRVVMVLGVVFLFGGLIALTYYLDIEYMMIFSVIGVLVSAVRFGYLFVKWVTS